MTLAAQTENKKPLVIYIDDEPRNLSLFELMVSEHFEVKLFDSAVEALKNLKTLDPWVIVSDQRMPNMTGLEFLELAAQILPNVPRIIMTGQTSEETIIKLVRHAKLFDYITKPVMEDDVIASLQKAVNFGQSQRDMARILREKDELTKSLTEKAAMLEKQNAELVQSRQGESAFKKEAEAWASAELIRAVVEDKVAFPLHRDLVCITYDIVNSSQYHDKEIEGVGLRGFVLNLFTSALLKHGGIPECHGGDAAFGHFGAFSDQQNAPALALAVAQDFRTSLRNLERIHQMTVECGIAVHLAPQALIQVHEVQVESSKVQRTKKFLSSASPHIDYLFRIEKLTHQLPGSNIIMSEEIFRAIPPDHQTPILLGNANTTSTVKQERCYLIPSYFAKEEQVAAFRDKFFESVLSEQNKAA